MKKVIKSTCAASLAFTMIFASCMYVPRDEASNPNVIEKTEGDKTSEDYKVEDGYLYINTDSDADNIWIWGDIDSSIVLGTWGAEGSGLQASGKNGSYTYFKVKLAAVHKSVGFILRKGVDKLHEADLTWTFVGEEQELFANASGDVQIFTGKSDSGDVNYKPTYTIEDGYLYINTLEKDAYDLYTWVGSGFADESISQCTGWGNDCILAQDNGDYKYFKLKMTSDATSYVFIIRDANRNKLNGGDNITYTVADATAQEIFLKAGSSSCQTTPIDTSIPTFSSVTITGEYTLKFTCSSNSLTKENFVVKGASGNIDIADVSGDTITLSKSVKDEGTLTVIFMYNDNVVKATSAIISGDLIDAWYPNVDISCLGYNDGVLTTWAPLAKSVNVVIYDSMEDALNGEISKTLSMEQTSNGMWELDGDFKASQYYAYQITGTDGTHTVCDIWNKVSAKNSVASSFRSIDDSKAKPTGWDNNYENPFSGAYSDAVIYEMHITDWCNAIRGTANSNQPGTFNEIAKDLNSNGKFAQHLKDLGITHVQILPMFEYNKTSDKDTEYNWGYNPYNYNAPESRYVEDFDDATDAVRSMREMIKAFHDQGISVIMDVVYNHTSGTGEGSLYDQTIPYYFYRTVGTDYSNGSGCGNEVATNHKVTKEFVIDSLKHWMKDYHINGFRFDLMGCQEKETMSDIYSSLRKIDPSVMVYGEPWTGGTSAVVNGATSAGAVTSTKGYAAFDDDFRDAIKGAEFGGFQFGTLQGNREKDQVIADGLCGKELKNARNSTGNPNLAIHYAECHDNYTLFDKLVYSTLDHDSIGGKDAIATLFKGAYDKVMGDTAALESIKSQEKLAAAYLLLSQGTPFLNGGQEFCRTKLGNPDSYSSDTKGGVKWSEDDITECNSVDLSLKAKFSDVYNTYKALIQFRKDNREAFGANVFTSANVIAPGVVYYKAGDYSIIFNSNSTATEEMDNASFTKMIDINEDDGTYEEVEAPSKASIPAFSFVILK